VTPFPRQLAPFAALSFAAVIGAAVLLVARYSAPDPGAFAVFAVLAMFSFNRVVRLPNTLLVSAIPMVLIAGVVVFMAHDAPVGALAVGAFGAVNLATLRAGGWGWIGLNAGQIGFSSLAAALVYSPLSRLFPAALPGALGVVVPIAVVYIAVAWSMLLLSYAIELKRVPREVLRDLLPTGPQTLPFMLLGYLLGRLYLSLGPAVMLLIIVPILIAREMFASYLSVKESHDETVQLLIRALEQKDPYTAGHAERVAVYAGYIGEELEFMPARMERLHFAALMHDIGKLVVPNQLLNKPGKLTEDEFKRVRIHEGVSVQMLSHIDFLRPIAGHTHSDNMRFDPDDLDHPIEPYIIMVADAYDAMTSTRSYRKALPQEVAFEELRAKSGTQFHPACAEALIRAIEKRHEVHGKGHEERLHFEDAPESGLGSAGLGDLLADDQAKQ
jgi:HD superfamily phosphohydrolase YqeK